MRTSISFSALADKPDPGTCVILQGTGEIVVGLIVEMRSARGWSVLQLSGKKPDDLPGPYLHDENSVRTEDMLAIKGAIIAPSSELSSIQWAAGLDRVQRGGLFLSEGELVTMGRNSRGSAAFFALRSGVDVSPRSYGEFCFLSWSIWVPDAAETLQPICEIIA